MKVKGRGDASALRCPCLKTKLLPDECVEADRGYRGDEKISAPDDDAPSLYHFYSKSKFDLDL